MGRAGRRPLRSRPRPQGRVAAHRGSGRGGGARRARWPRRRAARGRTIRAGHARRRSRRRRGRHHGDAPRAVPAGHRARHPARARAAPRHHRAAPRGVGGRAGTGASVPPALGDGRPVGIERRDTSRRPPGPARPRARASRARVVPRARAARTGRRPARHRPARGQRAREHTPAVVAHRPEALRRRSPLRRDATPPELQRVAGRRPGGAPHPRGGSRGARRDARPPVAVRARSWSCWPNRRRGPASPPCSRSSVRDGLSRSHDATGHARDSHPAVPLERAHLRDGGGPNPFPRRLVDLPERRNRERDVLADHVPVLLR